VVAGGREKKEVQIFAGNIKKARSGRRKNRIRKTHYEE
jgi:hypothetical protein